MRSSIAKRDGTVGDLKRQPNLHSDPSGSEPGTPNRAVRRPATPHERGPVSGSAPATPKSRLSHRPASPTARGECAAKAHLGASAAFSPQKQRPRTAHLAAAQRAVPPAARAAGVRASLATTKGASYRPHQDGTLSGGRAKPIASTGARSGAATLRGSVAASQAPQPWPTPPALAASADTAAAASSTTAVIDNPLAGSSPEASDSLIRSVSAPATTATGPTFRTAPPDECLITPTLAHWRSPAAEAYPGPAIAAGFASHRQHTPGSGDRSIGPLAPHVLEALRVNICKTAKDRGCPSCHTAPWHNVPYFALCSSEHSNARLALILAYAALGATDIALRNFFRRW